MFDEIKLREEFWNKMKNNPMSINEVAEELQISPLTVSAFAFPERKKKVVLKTLLKIHKWVHGGDLKEDTQ